MRDDLTSKSEPQSPTPARGGNSVSVDRARAAAPDADIWVFHAEPDVGGLELVGFAVEASDGPIGKVDATTFEVSRSYLDIDTGPWIFGKKAVLPAGVVERVDPDTATIFVNPTRDAIKNAPECGRELDAPSEDYLDRLADYYGRGQTIEHPARDRDPGGL